MPTREGAEQQARAAYAHGFRKDADLSVPRGTSRTELDVAKDIRDGRLSSPQRIGDLWLFDLRVTGTGVSYRDKYHEYVYRPPEFYLIPEFLKRCQGVPVLFEHPEKSLTTEEWRNRAIGSLMLPYLPAETHDSSEVWAIARIHDGDAAELMMTTHISTSPAVSFSAQDSLKKIRNADGSILLIEGRPAVFDHLAICPAGVWDKGHSPAGVNTGVSS